MRILKSVTAAVLASMIGILPGCGGGGMKMEQLMDFSARATASVRM